MALIDHPGCYGLPSAVSADSPSCVVCPARIRCVHAAQSFLEQLPDNPSIKRERLTLSATFAALTDAPRGSELMVGTPPKRIASQVQELSRRGWFGFARNEMRQGRNPAEKGWKKVFCDVLMSGGMSRANLQMALVEQLGLSPASAKMQTSVGISIFAVGKVASEISGTFKLLPIQSGDH